MNRILFFICALIFAISVNAQDEPYDRKRATVPVAESAPTLNAVREAEIYTGDGHVIDTWVVHGDPATTSPVDGVSSRFWFAYDDDYLYVFTEITVPQKHPDDEVICLVAIDAEDYRFGWEANPQNENGAIFSKAVFSGETGAWTVAPNEVNTIRQFEYIYDETADGYEIEFRVAWDNLTTEAALVDAFKNRRTFFFDIGYKLGGVEEHFFAWSNNNNKVHEETYTAGLVTLEYNRKRATVPHTATAPTLNAIRETDVYAGDGHVIDTWVLHRTSEEDPTLITSPVNDVSASFWFAYDDEYLYVFTEIAVPEKHPDDEVVCLVAIDAEDYRFGWEASPVNENGAIFSKAVFSGETGAWTVAPNEANTIRQFEYIYDETTDGYEIEFRVAWDNLTTDAELVAAFKERGTFFFDIGYKLGGNDNHFFAWSNNNNKVHEETYTAGLVTLGDVTSVQRIKPELLLGVYPNPASDVLYINTSLNVRIAEIYNLLGARVLTDDVRSGYLDISTLEKGMYIIRVNYDNGKSAVTKFVKY
jgi:hypothetical protein